jgi:glycerol-3-phosphate acyltransferase PlsY
VIAARVLYPYYLGLQILCGLLAILGHNWTVFLNWQGGKGVATSAGVLLALIPKQSLLAIAAFAAVFFSTGYVSLGSIVAALVLTASVFVIKTYALLRFLVIVAAGMVIYKHIPNLRRLRRGEENKVKFR